MTTFNDVFGNNTLPPSEYGYQGYTITADATLQWPYNSSDAPYTVAKVMNISCQAGNAIILPDARQVSSGEDLLVRNVGAHLLVVRHPSGVQLHDVEPGTAVYIYLMDNTTEDGVYGALDFGSGSSEVDASTLVGYGIKAIGASLNQSHPVYPYASGTEIDSTSRAGLVVSTGGLTTFTLAQASTLGDDFFFMFRNDGTGTATLEPYGSETIDNQLNMQIQPGESLMLVCTGTQWYSVGYGRSILYQFTQLTKDVSAGGTFTLTAAESENKLITFIGNPSTTVTVIVPSVVSVYYTYSNISTTQNIVVKTAAGTGTTITQTQRVILICDGTNVLSAQSAVANSSVSLTDGSAMNPALFFASQTNTGLYKSGLTGIGIAVGGVARLTFSGSLATFSDITNLKLPVLLADGATTVKVNLALA